MDLTWKPNLLHLQLLLSRRVDIIAGLFLIRLEFQLSELPGEIDADGTEGDLARCIGCEPRTK